MAPIASKASVGPGICMRSLFLKVLLFSFLAVVFVAIVPAASRLLRPPTGGSGQLGWVVEFLPLLSVGIGGLVCFLLARHITSPLYELRRGAEYIALGNLTARVPASLRNRRDEIGDLGRD